MRTGRPHKQIDKSQFESLCGIQCTMEEVCQFFDCDEKTLNKWCKDTYKNTFSQVFKEKKGVGKVSLRRSQFQHALKGNASMLIWLGKQYLGQRETPVDEAAANEDNNKHIVTLAEKINEPEPDRNIADYEDGDSDG